jgi:peptide/nickel transport system permease protein
MVVFFARRLLQLVPVALGASFLVFLLLFLIPGDPAVIIAGEAAPREVVEALRENLGLNDPFAVQYFRYLGNLLQGD